MKRRSGASGKPLKTRRGKAIAPKRRNAPKAVRPRSSSATGPNKQLASLTQERDELLEQQTATSEVLQIISSSPGELQPVFESILANATRICTATFGVLHLTEGDGFRTASLHNAPPDYVEAKRRDPIVRSPPKTSALYRVRQTRGVIQITDVHEE